MASSGRNTKRAASFITMLGIVAGFVIVLGWFVMPGVDRGWLVIGGLVLAFCGGVGLIATRPQRHEF